MPRKEAWCTSERPVTLTEWDRLDSSRRFPLLRFSRAVRSDQTRPAVVRGRLALFGSGGTGDRAVSAPAAGGPGAGPGLASVPRLDDWPAGWAAWLRTLLMSPGLGVTTPRIAHWTSIGHCWQCRQPRALYTSGGGCRPRSGASDRWRRARGRGRWGSSCRSYSPSAPCIHSCVTEQCGGSDCLAARRRASGILLRQSGSCELRGPEAMICFPSL